MAIWHQLYLRPLSQDGRLFVPGHDFRCSLIPFLLSFVAIFTSILCTSYSIHHPSTHSPTHSHHCPHSHTHRQDLVQKNITMYTTFLLTISVSFSCVVFRRCFHAYLLTIATLHIPYHLLQYSTLLYNTVRFRFAWPEPVVGPSLVLDLVALLGSCRCQGARWLMRTRAHGIRYALRE